MSSLRIKAERDQMARTLRDIVVESDLTLARLRRRNDHATREYIAWVRAQALEGLRAVADPIEVSHD